MTILFSMRHAGALRNFASTVEELARRGHRIHLVFMMHDKLRDGRLLQELTSAHAGITATLEKAPRRRWPVAVQRLRTFADYVRYCTPEYKDAHALHKRAARQVSPAVRALMQSPPMRSRPGLRVLTRLLRLAERAVPADPWVVRVVGRVNPDVVLVTPLVDFASPQVEYVKAARKLRIPCGLCVHSWDNLTNKGVIYVCPDRVFVWNDAQRREAVEMHGVPHERVVLTGAPSYDQWFDRRPSTTREAFCRKVGLPPDKPYVLYLCSSGFIASREEDFIKRWVRALRSATDSRVREAAVLVRPHPRTDMRQWSGFDPAEFPDVVVWPPGGDNPVDARSKSDYFDSIYHAVAAVGINTSAQIEAGIVGRQVFSVRAPEYVATQEGTLHFRYLMTEHGGLLHLAPTLEDHTRALAGAFDRTPEGEERLRAFVRGFVRPHGLDVPATPLLADAIERLGRSWAEATDPARQGREVTTAGEVR